MKRFIAFLSTISILVMSACSQDETHEGTILASSVTVEAVHVSAISAVLTGKANLGSTVAADLKVGFQYSKSAGILPSNSITVEATDADSDYSYLVGITGLEPETIYYYRSFVRQNGQDTYGETKEFSTKDATSLLETNEASKIEATTATMNAKLDLTDVQYKNLSYGFLWGSSEAELNLDFKCTEIKDNSISAALTGLSHKTQYWFKSYVKIDGQSFYGEVKTFTTDIIPVESISLDKTEYTFNTIGNTLALNATVSPADATDKSVEWSSDKESVATVDQNGNVNAIGNGTATITVTTNGQRKTATCAITVAQWVTSITLDKTALALNEGQEETLTATITPDNANDKTLKWTSSDENVASVDKTGKVTAVSKGSATIKAEANDGSGKYSSCSVTVNRLVSSIELDKASITIYNGETETITATVLPSSANNKEVTWTSSNSSAASVSSSGIVTGVSRGTATIVASAIDGSGVKAACEVEVKQYVTSITLSKTSLSLWEGEEETISVTSVLPDNANDKTCTWSSSDDSIASVDQNGSVTAKAAGSTVLKATANDGSEVSSSCDLIVYRVPTAVDMGLPSGLKWASFNLGATAPEGYGYYYAWGETEPKDNYSWGTYCLCNGSSTSLTKYNKSSSYGTIDNMTEFKDYDYEDDAARQALGGSWRIPTDAEWTELRDHCTWTWVMNYNGTGINGRLVMATNGNSIFLPASGLRTNANLNSLGSRGYYWSSSRHSSYSYQAWGIYFFDSNYRRYNNDRRYGYSVRPVSE